MEKEYGYHITNMENLEMIIKKGMIPRIGCNSRCIGGAQEINYGEGNGEVYKKIFFSKALKGEESFTDNASSMSDLSKIFSDRLKKENLYEGTMLGDKEKKIILRLDITGRHINGSRGDFLLDPMEEVKPECIEIYEVSMENFNDLTEQFAKKLESMEPITLDEYYNKNMSELQKLNKERFFRQFKKIKELPYIRSMQAMDISTLLMDVPWMIGELNSKEIDNLKEVKIDDNNDACYNKLFDKIKEDCISDGKKYPPKLQEYISSLVYFNFKTIESDELQSGKIGQGMSDFNNYKLKNPIYKEEMDSIKEKNKYQYNLMMGVIETPTFMRDKFEYLTFEKENIELNEECKMFLENNLDLKTIMDESYKQISSIKRKSFEKSLKDTKNQIESRNVKVGNSEIIKQILDSAYYRNSGESTEDIKILTDYLTNKLTNKYYGGYEEIKNILNIVEQKIIEENQHFRTRNISIYYNFNWRSDISTSS